jgi:hypothetical protein
VTRLYILIAVLLAGLAAGGGGAWKVQDWRYGAKERERLDAIERDRRFAEKRVDTAATGHESDKAQIRTEFITITETVERIVREPFYAPGAPACLDPDGMRQLRSAIAPASAASQPAPAVRRPTATD